MTGTPERDEFYALAGNDDLFGRRGDDEFRGAEGNDDFYGGAGNDMYYYLQSNWDADRVKADPSGAEDWLVIFSGAAESLLIDLRPTPGQKEVVLGANTINFARNVSIEWVQAGSGPDEVTGNPRSNYILGGDDGDRLSGRGGDDRLIGDIEVFSNVGDDRLRGGSGRDRLEGGDGDDTILARDGERDRIKCGEGDDTVRFDSGLDRVGASCEL